MLFQKELHIKDRWTVCPSCGTNIARLPYGDDRISVCPVCGRYLGNPDPCRYKLNPVYHEKKSKRIQLLWTESLYEGMKSEAENENISVNSLVHRILSRWLEGKK